MALIFEVAEGGFLDIDVTVYNLSQGIETAIFNLDYMKWFHSPW